MSVQILSLATGQLSNSTQTIYTSPTTPTPLTSIVKSIRLVNTTSSPVTVNLYISRFVSPGTYDTRHLIPISMSVPGSGAAIDDQEITMASGDLIKGDASVNNVVDFVISGIQR